MAAAQGMRSRILLNLVLVLALLALTLYAYFRPKHENTAAAIKVSQLGRDDVNRILIERRGSPPIRLEKRDGVWHIAAPLRTLADPYQVDRLVDIAGAKAKSRLPLSDPGRFDLDPPQVRVTLNEQPFSFGRINDVTYEQYLATGDSIYLVPPFHGYGVPADVNSLVNRKLLHDSEMPVAFEFGRYRIVRGDRGDWSAEGASPWKRERPPSQDDFNRWVDEWRLASGLSAQPHKGERGKEQVTLRFKNGKSVVLHVLRKQPDFQLVRADSGIGYRFGLDAGRRLLDPSGTIPRK